MTRKLPKRGLPPMHPGELLREEILPALDRPKTEIPKLLGVSRQTLYDVLKEKQPVTPAWRYGSESCAEMVPISGSIYKSGTICIRPSKSSERRSRRFPRWKSPERSQEGAHGRNHPGFEVHPQFRPLSNARPARGRDRIKPRIDRGLFRCP